MDENFSDTIRNITVSIDNVDGGSSQAFQWLSEQIYLSKVPLKTNSVKFIIVKILNKKKESRNISIRPSFDVYVIGEFRKTFNPTLRVAEAFAEFYLEMGILPNIISIPEHILIKNRELLHKIRNGVRIYERR
ncbi:hypothetical protein OZ666_07265 [Elizabethkingia sp. HX QKY]|uniref:hypothetical protein n=1 Tax=Elizabethkingia TaxID=308865 RepID=UPI00293C281E|nr:hypothetical protein [Elizabethkingia sp. HX QKY]MDV3539406.1 hypothetical protein [Elizabethkingia anophelis]MDX8571474.1 hypothetical protein [Elizabethkingia sp. HX QKY]